MSIIIIGVGQAEFDGESPPPPDKFPQRLQALGSDPSQKSKDSHPGLCETVWVSRQGVRVRLFAQGGVCQGAYPTPTPKAVGRRPQVTPPASTLGACAGWGRGGLPGTGSSCLLASAFSSLTRGLGRRPLSCQAQVPSC